MESITEMEQVEHVDQVEEVKRGRGRPRKERIISDVPTGPKKRGRPRKVINVQEIRKNKNLDLRLLCHLRKTISPNTIKRTIKVSMSLVQCVAILTLVSTRLTDMSKQESACWMTCATNIMLTVIEY